MKSVCDPSGSVISGLKRTDIRAISVDDHEKHTQAILEKKRILGMESDINSMRSELNQIKDLLQQLLSK